MTVHIPGLMQARQLKSGGLKIVFVTVSQVMVEP